MTDVRVFVSSPGDVGEERLIAQRVLVRLRGEFAHKAIVEPFFWEHEPLRATATYQKQILRPSETDIVVIILWSRLGTRLPPDITRPDGSRYESGTEFEFEDFSGGMDGMLRAVSTGNGQPIWEFDTAKEFSTVNGVIARGGSIGAGGPIIANGMVFVGSGYVGFQNGVPGNVMLGFDPS